MVSYHQRKIKTSYQSLSPRGGEVWRGVKIYDSKREIEAFIFFFFRMKPPCLLACGEGVGGGVLVPQLGEFFQVDIGLFIDYAVG